MLRAHAAWFRAGFRRYSTYRAATAAGAATNTVFGLVKASLTVGAVAAAGGRVAGYDARAASTYAWLAQALLAPVAVFAATELAERIRTGDIAVDLSRPIDLQTSLLAQDLGRATFQVLPRALPPLVVGALAFGLTLPTAPAAIALGTASVAIGVCVSFACRFLLNLSAFWLLEVRGAATLYTVACNLFCGLVIPLAWFPGWLEAVARATPFPSMLQAPIDVLTGRATGSGAAGVVGVQLAWLAVTMGLGRIVLGRATAKLVVQGG